MTSVLGVAVCGLAALVVLSACLGAPKATLVPPEETIPPPDQLYTDTTCGVWGTVTDDVGLPVAEAQVILIVASGPLREYWTASDGKYAFANLDVGTYKIQANKSGLAQEDEFSLLRCLPGEVNEIPILLIEAPDPRAPRIWTPIPERGRVGCSARAVSVVLSDPCRTADPAARNTIAYRPPVGNVTGAFIEVDWQQQASPLGGDRLTVQFPKTTVANWTWESESETTQIDSAVFLTGPPPLRFRMEVNDTVADRLFEITSKTQWTVTLTATRQTAGGCIASPESCPPIEVVHDLTFDVYLSFYYWGMPMPSLADHSDLPP